MSTLRAKVIRLAHQNPELRPHLLPLLKQAGCEKLPEGPMRDNCEKKKEDGEEKTAARTVKVWEVIYDGKGSGPSGDGTFIYRTRDQREAEAFAKQHTAWGRPTKAQMTEAPKHIAERWGIY